MLCRFGSDTASQSSSILEWRLVLRLVLVIAFALPRGDVGLVPNGEREAFLPFGSALIERWELPAPLAEHSFAGAPSLSEVAAEGGVGRLLQSRRRRAGLFVEPFAFLEPRSLAAVDIEALGHWLLVVAADDLTSAV